jgi:hypothetical protein
LGQSLTNSTQESNQTFLTSYDLIIFLSLINKHFYNLLFVSLYCYLTTENWRKSLKKLAITQLCSSLFVDGGVCCMQLLYPYAMCCLCNLWLVSFSWPSSVLDSWFMESGEWCRCYMQLTTNKVEKLIHRSKVETLKLNATGQICFNSHFYTKFLDTINSQKRK